jgi:cytidylate kinase
LFAIAAGREDSRPKPKGNRLIIAIDGPSGAGKSTLAKRLAKDLGFIYLRQAVDLADDSRLGQLVDETEIDLRHRDGNLDVLLDGEDVSGQIRTPAVSQMASKVSALKKVRDRMLVLQRALGRRGSVVAEGRDIGTVIFPGADVKIYLDASPEERARRRCQELTAAGRQVDLQETLREIEERDQRDRGRDIAPLCKAADALLVDSSSVDAEQVAALVLNQIKNKAREN